jgi:beta-galactosidase
VVSTVETATAGKPAAISLSVDRSTMAADRRDVAHVEVSIVDSAGRVVPTADNEVTFEIQGAGRSIGLDGGNMGSHEDYKGNTRRAYSGLCLAMIQSTQTAGQIRVTATSPGLESASTIVNTAA